MKTVGDLILGQDLKTIGPKESIFDAQRRMEESGVHSLLVFEGGKPESGQFLGIVTMTDTASSMFGQNDGTVRSIMTHADEVQFVSVTTPLAIGAQFMRKYEKHHMVVRDLEGKVVGVISSMDLMITEDNASEEAAEVAKNLQPS